jgi:uncharacterized repeat protein (TIGR01451 family)
MKKTLLYSIIALVLVLGLILPMTVPVMASDIEASKHRDPDEAPYAVGETIYYVMTVTNPGNNTATNTLTRIWDTLPNGTVIEFLGANETLVQVPGQTGTFNASYIVRAADFEWIYPPAADPYWGVRNTFRAEGLVGGEVPKEVLVEDVAEVILPPPPVGGEAFPVSRLFVLAPWIALGAAIIAGAAIFVRRRQVRS